MRAVLREGDKFSPAGLIDAPCTEDSRRTRAPPWTARLQARKQNNKRASKARAPYVGRTARL
jgi:hypothetical protein